VSIRSITRRRSSGLPTASERVSTQDGAETVTYLADSQETPGPISQRLLKRLQDIQFGRVQDEFNWNEAITAKDTSLGSQ
jgi:hypothetical protein